MGLGGLVIRRDIPFSMCFHNSICDLIDFMSNLEKLFKLTYESSKVHHGLSDGMQGAKHVLNMKIGLLSSN